MGSQQDTTIGSQQDITDSTTFNDKTDITEQLLHRYGKSSAPQHRHLIATAAATRSILTSESLPLTPLSYFAATISTLSDSKTLDTDALAALSSFLAIVLPLVPEKAIAPDKAAEAVGALVNVLEIQRNINEAALGTSSARALVKCLGVLVGFCDLGDWDSVELGFHTLLKYSIDKRPKVRKCAQDCLLVVFKSIGSSSGSKKASKSVYSLLKDHMPMAVELNYSKPSDRSKDNILTNPEHQEVLHVLNVLKSVVPYLSTKICTKILSQVLELMTSQFSAMTRHIFEIVTVVFDSLRTQVIVQDVESIIKFLVSYISRGEKNPVDTVLSAATLATSAIDKIHASETSESLSYVPLVIGAVAGLLESEAGTAVQASSILKELIRRHLETKNRNVNRKEDDEAQFNTEIITLKSVCSIFENMLKTGGGIPNEHVMMVISVLFLKLGSISDIYMKDIVLHLADLMSAASDSTADKKHLEECIGSAVVAMGPEKLLALLPISLAEDLSCSNTWLIPLLRRYVVGSSLGFYMQHIIPLAESFQQASHKVKKSKIGQDLQAYAHGLWELLPAFCRYPSDVYQSFGALVDILICFLKDSFMLENIAIALQEIVNQNRSALTSIQGLGSCTELPQMEVVDSRIELKSIPSYSRKAAARNLRALASCSEELMKALSDALFKTPLDSHDYLKDAMQCLASITDSSVTKKIFISSLKRFQFISDSCENEKLELAMNDLTSDENNNQASVAKDTNRCLILELASSIVEGADEDLVTLLFSFTKRVLEATDGLGHLQAYQALRKILEKHSWFCSSHFVELVDLLLGAMSPADVPQHKSRLACLQTLLIFVLKGNFDEETAKAFLILNEIIVMLKESKEEGRKAAYDALIETSSSLQKSSSTTPDGSYHKLITMIMGYLSGSSPQIKSGAVSALSILVYNDSDICLKMPELLPSVLELLQLKAVEVIKAVLGFMKVVVSSLPAKDLNNFAADVVDAILPWSSMSRHHFKSKVTVILEIMMRKCGSAAIKLLVPEKYQKFLHSVTENRRGASSSREASTMDSDWKSEDASFGRQKKRNYSESTMPTKEEGFRGTRERKRENKHRNISSSGLPNKSSSFTKSGKRLEQSGHSVKVGHRQHKRDSRSNSDGPPAGGKRKERSKSFNKSKENIHRTGVPSKDKKHNMFGNKRQKMNG